jgi:AcrR family transcriptional regulator
LETACFTLEWGIKMAKNAGAKTKRNKFTRMCIGESIIALMHETPYDDIKISDVARKAGVSRMTFYQYYATKEEALSDYLDEIVEEYIETEGGNIKTHTLAYDNVLRALKFFDRYSDFFLSLVDARRHSFVMDAVNDYVAQYLMPENPRSRYELYYHAGALFNVFLQWELTGKQEPVEEIAKLFV